MTTSLTPSLISVIPKDGKPTADQLIYFGRRFRNDLHGEVLRCFLQEKLAGLTRAELARRLDKDPAQITRWLSAPKNATMETISQLLLAMGYVPVVKTCRIENLDRCNEHHPLADENIGLGVGSSVATGGTSATRFDPPRVVQ